MRSLSFLSLARFAAAAFAIAAGHFTGASAETNVATKPVSPADTNRISGPYIHDNLAIYFVHGPSAPGPVPLTLAEALEGGDVKVLETGTVDTLEIENQSDSEIYIQAGDIVKGGKQDRVLTTSLVLPPQSGKVAIGSYCVEQGRWAARGKEDMKAFASARDAMPSRKAKLAMNRPAPPRAAPDPTASTALQNRIPSYTEGRPGNPGRQQHVDGVESRSTQGEVWQEVATTQMKLAASLSVASVTAEESKSSLQLTLENEKLRTARDGYLTTLADTAKAEGDIIGFVFSVNGKLNSADIYPSTALFQKMWPKLLNASITEAIGERGATDAGVEAPPTASVAAFLAAAEQGKAEENAVGSLMKRETRDTANALYVEARRNDGGFVHRTYLAK